MPGWEVSGAEKILCVCRMNSARFAPVIGGCASRPGRTPRRGTRQAAECLGSVADFIRQTSENFLPFLGH